MSIKLLSIGAVALSLIAGSALAAGNNSSTTGNAGAGTSALDNATKMQPFYTDSDMKTMKSDTDLKAAWLAMNKDDRDSMMKDCADATIAKAHTEFCQMTTRLGPAK